MFTQSTLRPPPGVATCALLQTARKPNPSFAVLFAGNTATTPRSPVQATSFRRAAPAEMPTWASRASPTAADRSRSPRADEQTRRRDHGPTSTGVISVLWILLLLPPPSPGSARLFPRLSSFATRKNASLLFLQRAFLILSRCRPQTRAAGLGRRGSSNEKRGREGWGYQPDWLSHTELPGRPLLHAFSEPSPRPEPPPRPASTSMPTRVPRQRTRDSSTSEVGAALHQ